MSDAATKLRVEAPGKVNLVLRVLGRRADGYHELDTTLLAIDRVDELVVRRAPEGLRLSVAGPCADADVPRDGSNLAALAAALVLERARELGRLPQGLGLSLELEKRLPSQAGLGGGSSDAAAALEGAARLLGLDPLEATLREQLAVLGSDCPFFLEARSTGLARCRGRGERVEPIGVDPIGGGPAAARALVVLVPEIRCSTARVYAAFRPKDVARGRVADFRPEAPLQEARAALVNDLEPAAIRSHPGLAPVRADLERVGAGHFRLCGSGSAFFGLFDGVAEAEAFLTEHVTARKGRDYALRAAFVARPWRASVPG
jgi:4-diphosphocytidyl-2-C-methyl-D-erythritol kinase